MSNFKAATPAQITSFAKSHTNENKNHIARSLVFHARRHSNYDPVKTIFSLRERKETKAMAQTILAYVAKHAPCVGYDKKTKSMVWIPTSHTDITDEEVQELPDCFVNAPKKDPEFKVSKFDGKVKLFEKASKDDIIAELAAVNAYLAKVKAELESRNS